MKKALSSIGISIFFVISGREKADEYIVSARKFC